MLLREYLPEFISCTKEFTELFKVEQPQVDELFKQINNRLTDMFVLNSSEYATERYENIVGIIPKLSDSLKKRQLDVLAIYNEVPPFTYERLIEMLNAIIGDDGYKISLDIPKFFLKIKLRRDNLQFINQVNDMLERIVPVNIILDYSVDYNTWEDISYFNWKDLQNSNWMQVLKDEKFNSVK